MAKCRHPKRYVADLGDNGVTKERRCYRCGWRLSIGPSNDDIPLEELILAETATSDDMWRGREIHEQCDTGHDWDVTRPLREQWPWCYPNPSARAMEAVAEFRSQMPVASEPMLTDTEASSDALVDEPVHAWRPGRPEPPDDAIRAAASGNNHDPGWQERVEAKIELMRRSRGDEFAPSDTASREPWHTTQETQLSDADRAETNLRESVAELVTVVPDGAA